MADRQERRTTGSRALVTAILLGLVGIVVGAATWAAYVATTSNTGNAATSGTLAITDNDGGSTPMLSLSTAKPNDTDTSCIKVTNSGSLAAEVRLYGATTGTGLDAYTSLVVTRGSYS